MMSETRDKGARRAARGAKAGTTSAGGQNHSFAVVAHNEGVLLVDTVNGRSWTLSDAGGQTEWHPVAFGGNAERAPRGSLKERDAEA